MPVLILMYHEASKLTGHLQQVVLLLNFGKQFVTIMIFEIYSKK